MSDEAVVVMIDALERSGIPYMLVGSFSSNYYGVPRSTHDADFVVQLEREAFSRLMRALPPEVKLDPQLSFETVTGTSRYIATVADCAFKMELFILSDDPHDQTRFGRRRSVELLGRKTYLATAEDVVIQKLRWLDRARRNKDLDDLRNVIAVSGNVLDWDYIHGWCDKHGTREKLDEIRRSISDINA